MSIDLVKHVEQKFKERFGEHPKVFRSPGRVNIIGEHTDYNNGFVLPAAIDKAIFIGISPREDQQIVLYSEEFRQEHKAEVFLVKPSEKQWPNYILGVVDQLNKRGYKISGFNLNIEGNVPIGSGLSSSAAVECATAFALNSIFNLGIDKHDLVLIAQKAEHEFAGVLCGIMDQFASMFGKKDHVIRLDCRTIDFEYVPLNLGNYKIVLLNTNVKHSLASSEYNTRRKECHTGVEMVQEKYPQVKSLRDVTLQMLDECVKPKENVIYKRCKYVVEENARLFAACDAMAKGDLKTLGKNMYGSHDGLSKEYEVSCKELDFLVDAVRSNETVLGARMMGGGFGGCTINIVREDAINQLVEQLSSSYQKNMGLELTSYVAETADGSSEVK
jgi:galactokinase